MTDASFLIGLADATVSASTVLILAGLGELISERAGILNLGVEGMILVGALSGVVATVMTGSYWIGFAVGSICGLLTAAIHAFLCISLKADQAISGIMLTLLGTGVTTYFGQQWASAQFTGFPDRTLPVIGGLLVEIPFLGPTVFEGPATDFVALGLVVVVWWLLTRTNLGLEMISVGEDPETADTMGIDVFKMRYLAVLIGGLFAGAAGAHLSLAFNGIWTNNIAAGQGWIAVALVIFARWRPGRLLFGAYLFGLFNSLRLRSQSLDLALGPESPLAGLLNPVIGFLLDPAIMSMYPYIVTLVVLVATIVLRRDNDSAQPAALVQAYSREAD
jgi:simple sugar transport system permease protein